MIRAILAAATALTLAACGAPGQDDPASAPADAEARVVNVYSARHYDSDEAVYAAFTEATGIEINLLEAGGDQLIERVRADGARSPADVIITVDAARLHRAEQAGLFAVSDYSTLEGVPENLRDPEGYWFGFAKRARVIAASNERVAEGEITSYQDLADERWRGRLCVRSASSPYNQSLLAGLIDHLGPEAAEDWAAGIVANFARPPQGGDRGQIAAIAAGECDVAIVNHYYYAMLAQSEDAGDQAAAAATRLIFPDEGGTGVHVNISGAGLAVNAPHPEEARALLDFLVSPQAQRYFAELSNEYPAVEGAGYDNPTLDGFGAFQADTVNMSVLGDNNEAAVRIFDRVGWP